MCDRYKANTTQQIELRNGKNNYITIHTKHSLIISIQGTWEDVMINVPLLFSLSRYLYSVFLSLCHCPLILIFLSASHPFSPTLRINNFLLKRERTHLLILLVSSTAWTLLFNCCSLAFVHPLMIQNLNLMFPYNLDNSEQRNLWGMLNSKCQLKHDPYT